jgi:hypothetical protein
MKNSILYIINTLISTPSNKIEFFILTPSPISQPAPITTFGPNLVVECIFALLCINTPSFFISNS